MVRCINCAHWNIKAERKEYPALAQLGFARCKKVPAQKSQSGAYERDCQHFEQADSEAVKNRTIYLKKC
jgi:hypothetical protein